MRESSLIPTNLLNWPRVADRLPEEKLILLALWSAPWLSSAGAGELPLRPFAASLGLDFSSTLTGIQNLIKIGLIDHDVVTDEIFIADWFRFHKFRSNQSQSILRFEIEKVRSETLKNTIRLKSATCLPTITSTTTKDISQTQNPPLPPSGVPPEGAGDDGINLNQSQDQRQSQSQKRLGRQDQIQIQRQKQKRKAEAEAAQVAIPEWLVPEDWAAFIEHRRVGIKKPMTAQAQRLAIDKLGELRAAGHDPDKVINQSIISGWSGLFEVRAARPAVPQSRQTVRDVLSGMHHGFDQKDYSAGVTADGYLID